MSKRIRIVIYLVFLFSCVFRISNLKAEGFEHLEHSNGVICMPSEIGPIPIIQPGHYWGTSNDTYVADSNNLVSNTMRSFHCLAVYNTGSIYGMDNAASYYAAINPTWRVYFPVFQNAARDWIEGDLISKEEEYKLYIDVNKIVEVDGISIKFNDQIQEIKDSLNKLLNLKAFPDLDRYAKKTCEKYCNKCQYEKGNYSYYCNDYNLKDGIHVLSPSNFSGHNQSNMTLFSSENFKAAFRWTFSGFSGDYLDELTEEGWIRVIDSCKDVNCVGEIVKFNGITNLVSNKKCMNYVSEKSAGFKFDDDASSVNDIDGWRYWVCESKADCESSCFGTCVSPEDYSEKTLSTLNSINKDVGANLCIGTKIRSTKFKNGDSTEDFKYYTKNYDDLTSLVKYDGDGIPATLGNIYKVGTGKITCEGVFGKDGKGQFAKILRDVFKYIRVIGIALFVIFTSLDFIKAISGSDDKPIKAVTKNLTTRFIVLLILLVLPTLINIVLSIIEIKNGLCFLN